MVVSRDVPSPALSRVASIAEESPTVAGARMNLVQQKLLNSPIEKEEQLHVLIVEDNKIK